jgi:hypothetical protein
LAKKFKTLRERMTAESRTRARKRAGALSAEETGSSVRGLISEMYASFVEAQNSAAAKGEDRRETSEEELEGLIGEALRRARKRERG